MCVNLGFDGTLPTLAMMVNVNMIIKHPTVNNACGIIRQWLLFGPPPIRTLPTNADNSTNATSDHSHHHIYHYAAH
jgi:hypothetical protein